MIAPRLRRACAASFVLALALWQAGSARAADVPAAAAPAAKVTVSYGTLEVADTPLWIAAKAGLFKKRGIDADVVYRASGSVQIASLIAGDAQLAVAAGGDVVNADAAGADIIMLATLSPIIPYLFMVPAEIKTTAQLKGKIVGVSKIGDASDIGARIALARAGLKPGDVQILQVGSSSNRAMALMAGSIQGGVVIPPMDTILEAHGLHVLIDVARLRIPVANATIAASRTWVNAHRNAVQQCMDAIVEAFVRMQSDRPYALALIKENFKSDDDRALAHGYDFYTHELVSSTADLYVRPAQLDASMTELAKTNEKIKDVDVTKIIDSSFLRNAIARAGRRPR